MEEPTPTLDDFSFEQLLTPVTEIRLDTLLAEQPELFERMRRCDPVKLAATFAGFLTEPALQSSSVRLEALVHLSLALANGALEMSNGDIKALFDALTDSAYGKSEDPAEDVFIGLVTTPRG